MKAVEIGFIDDGRHSAEWFVAVLCCVIVTVAVGWRWHEIRQDERARAEEAAQQMRRAAELKAKAEAPDPHSAEKEAFRKLLGVDLNKVFSCIERVDEPGTRLRNMDVDVAQNSVRLEYEIDSMAKASSLTFALNSERERRPWRLQSVSPTGGVRDGGPQKFSGIWSAAIDEL